VALVDSGTFRSILESIKEGLGSLDQVCVCAYVCVCVCECVCVCLCVWSPAFAQYLSFATFFLEFADWCVADCVSEGR
jgi:hypothetical protein